MATDIIFAGINHPLESNQRSQESWLGYSSAEAALQEREMKLRLRSRWSQELRLSNVTNHRQHIKEMKGEAVTGSCVWILSDESYQAWSEGSDSKLLWLSGGPGKGKTVISIFLTEELDKLAEGDENKAFIYFFCDNRNENQKSASAILRSLIWQLLIQRSDQLFQYILPKFQVAHEKLLVDRIALWGIFEEMILSLNKCQTYCVVDGLDECDPESLSFLVTMLEATPLLKESPSGGTLKLIVTSRDTDELRRLSCRGFPRVNLDSPSLRGIVETNLGRFIVRETEKLARENDYPPGLQEVVKKVLTKGANGTFLWVALVCRELRGVGSHGVPKTLQRLPQGLSGVYQRMIDEVPLSWRNTIATILRWITLAARPLTLKELAIATKTLGNDKQSLEESMEACVLHCGGLLEIDQDARVTFIHQSAKDYLLNEAPAFFRVEKATASLELAATCHRYIRETAFQYGPIITSTNGSARWGGGGDEVQRQSEKRLKPFPFLAYATLYWPAHLRESGSTEGILYSESEWNPNLREAWWVTYCDMVDDRFYSKCKPTVLQVASFLGLTILVKEILADHGKRLSAEEQTALPWAARAGHLAIVKLLLKNGIDPNVGKEFGTALSWAATNRHKPLVELLLEQEGVDVNSRSRWLQTPLSHAAENGDQAVVELLLSRPDVDAGLRDNWGRTPLSFAAGSGHQAVVGQLQRSGRVSFNLKTDEDWTILLSSAENGHKAVVRHLLDWAGLPSAAKIGHETVTEILMGRRDVDANLKDKLGRYLLSYAVEHGLLVVANLLLAREDVDANLTDSLGRTPLLIAIEKKHESVARLIRGRQEVGNKLEQRSGSKRGYVVGEASAGLTRRVRQKIE